MKALLFLLPVLGLALPPVELMPQSQAMRARGDWAATDGRVVSSVAGTGSMRPYIFGGEILLMERYAGQTIEPGMLVVAPRWDAVRGVLHEVTEVSRHGYVKTQGRNCTFADGWYRKERTKFVVRRVIRITPVIASTE
jgi:hypothetical protein